MKHTCPCCGYKTLDEKLPMELLLLADPSRECVEEYINRGECLLVSIFYKGEHKLVFGPAMSSVSNMIQLVYRSRLNERRNKGKPFERMARIDIRTK